MTAIGSAPHLAGVALERASGARWQYVPYKGGVQAVQDTVAGQTQVLMNGMLATLPQVQAGKLKVLGVSKSTRMPLITRAHHRGAGRARLRVRHLARRAGPAQHARGGGAAPEPGAGADRLVRGRINRNDEAANPTSVCQRSSLLKSQFQVYWTDPAQDAFHIKWIADLYDEYFAQYGGKPSNQPGSPFEGCYINYPDTDMKYTDASHTHSTRNGSTCTTATRPPR